TRFSRDWSSDVCSSDLDIKTPYERKSFMGRVSWDFTDNMEGVFEYSYSESMSEGESILGRNQGGTGANNGCTRTGYSGTRVGNRSEERRVGKERRCRTS